MNKEKIVKIFNGKIGNKIGKYKIYGIMILIYENQGQSYLILEKRALSLRSQPGDICLPGGKLEQGETPKEAALRETMEELNLKREEINYVGEMDYFITPYGSILYPFVSTIDNFPSDPSKGEVDELIMLPIDFLISEKPYEYKMNIGPRNYDDFPFDLINGGKDYKFSEGTMPQYFYKYENYVIWGFTARVIKEFADIIKEEVY